MKIVICGDSHIGAVFGLGGPNGSGGNTRVDDYEKTLNYIVDYCIDAGVDIFVQTGDAFDKRNPTPEQMDIFSRALKRLSANNIFSIVIMGNHDYKRAGGSYSSAISSLSAKDMPNVRTVISPELMTVNNFSDSPVNLLLMPFRDRRMYSGASTKEDSLLYEEEVAGMISSSPAGPIVAIGHNFFYEGSYNDYGGSEVLPRPTAFRGCDMVAMGHYHNFKIIKKSDPISIYTGAMERVNFGDADSKKVFIEYNTDTRRTKVHTTPVRDLWDGEISVADSTFESVGDDLEAALSSLDIKDKIVRVKVVLYERLASSIKKQFIEKRLYELGAHFVSKISFEYIYQRMIRDTSILGEKDDYSMFKAFVEDQGLDSELEKRLLLEAETIFNQNNLGE